MFWELLAVLSWIFGTPAAVLSLFFYVRHRRGKRAEAKIRDWLLLLGYNVIHATKDYPRSHLLKSILLQSQGMGDRGCGCGSFQVVLSEVVPAIGGGGLVRVVELGLVCPRCGRTEIPGRAWKKGASSLGRRMEHETNFFDLIEVMIHEDAEKAAPRLSDEVVPSFVPARMVSRTF